MIFSDESKSTKQKLEMNNPRAVCGVLTLGVDISFFSFFSTGSFIIVRNRLNPHACCLVQA
jgi:hypothetical protein